jgi:hypothetical protein
MKYTVYFTCIEESLDIFFDKVFSIKYMSVDKLKTLFPLQNILQDDI